MVYRGGRKWGEGGEKRAGKGKVGRGEAWSEKEGGAVGAFKSGVAKD